MTDSNDLSPAPVQSALTPSEKQTLYKLLLESDLGGFVREAWHVVEPHTQFYDNWHLDLICEYLTLVRKREIRRLIINVPPRHMKSLTVTVFFPAWVWAAEPHTRFICSSFADSLATKHNLDRRTIIESPWYQSLWGDRVEIAADQNQKTEFLNTARGHMIATSVGGSITGKGGNIVIVDDPHNPLQVLSETARNTAINHFSQALSTRLDDPRRDAIIVVMQRLHEQDLTGHLLEQQGWDHLFLPAEAEREERWKFPIKGTIHTRQPGELLWPERFPQKVLDDAKVRLGSYAYAGQYQQRPSPAEGGILKRGWWRRYDTVPERFDQVIQSWDFTFKDSKGSDFVVGQVWGKVGANRYLLDQVRGRFTFSQSLGWMRTMSTRWPQAHAKLVEDKANGPAIIDTLRGEIPGIIPVQPLGSKIARAQAAAPELEAGNYHLPNSEYADEFIEECTAFPNGAHDDQVDAWSQAASRFRTSSSGIMEYYREAAKVPEAEAAA
ncbi:MAG: phage terminase large subunit [Candidatus Acidiferrum sp.]